MEDQEILEELNEAPEEFSPFDGENDTDFEGDPAEVELIDEVEIEENSLSSEEVDLLREILASETVSENNISDSSIDYTSDLTAIKYELISINSQLSSLSEYQEQTIFDKQLIDYTVSEGFLVFIVVFFFINGILSLIRKFTPKIWS